MDFNKAHQGQNRQQIGPEEAELQEEAGLTPGITPDLHAPDLTDEMDPDAERNLHGDDPDSPFATPKGDVVVVKETDKGKDADKSEGTPRADAAATREREIEAQRTGRSTEALAREDEAEDEAPKPKKPAKK